MENETVGTIAILIPLILVMFGLTAIMITAYWKVFTKAGKPGWVSLVPFYNIIVFLDIAGKPTWWILLMLIPIVNFIVGIMALAAFNEKFGKSTGFLLGLIFFSPIFFLILAFDDSTYQA